MQGRRDSIRFASILHNYVFFLNHGSYNLYFLVLFSVTYVFFPLLSVIFKFSFDVHVLVPKRP